MAAITSPQAVAFVNERARPMADLISKMRRTLPQFMLEVVSDFEANTGGNVNGDTVSDGAAEDGRTVLNKGDIAALKFVVEQLETCLATDDRTAIAAKPSVNSQPIF